MTQKGSDTPIPDQATSRRLFFKFLAASPLAALAYSAAPSNWLEPLSGAEPSVGSAPVRCAGCGVELPPLYAPTDDPSLSGLVPQEMPQELPPQEPSSPHRRRQSTSGTSSALLTIIILPSTGITCTWASMTMKHGWQIERASIA